MKSMAIKTVPATDSATELHDLIGDDATATFESDPKFIGANPTSTASSENVEEQRDTDDVEDEDDDLEDDDDELEDDEDEDEEDEDEDDLDDEDVDDEDEDDDLDDEDEDEEDDEEEVGALAAVQV
jgi:hypothetical protein